LKLVVPRPGAVGVPLITPPELSASPAGSEPTVTDQVKPPDPPDAARFCEYVAPISPCGSVAPVVMLGPGVTVSVRGAVLAVALAESVTWKTMPVAVVAVGDSVPEIAPLGPSSDRTAGNAPDVIAQWYGGVPPVAPKVVPA